MSTTKHPEPDMTRQEFIEAYIKVYVDVRVAVIKLRAELGV